eukprot:1958118-Amphidinium_carterae.2
MCSFFCLVKSPQSRTLGWVFQLQPCRIAAATTTTTEFISPHARIRKQESSSCVRGQGMRGIHEHGNSEFHEEQQADELTLRFSSLSLFSRSHIVRSRMYKRTTTSDTCEFSCQ